MHPMILASLALNIAVLVPVCVGLATRANWTVAAYGPVTPARGILLSIYMALLISSAALLLMPVTAMVAGLLAVQIVYKLTTPFTVESFTNSVVVSNLAIAAVHAVTLVTIWEETFP
ncbi:hypothetical protein [Erythrobacter sp. WG]|uniref:hypothetical protein n=1 Tax=Erythrobacter sp. WG TaxID=2985510 RepID=UPI00226DF218|nr:hypothetical protein [Erythrobacter sp. WG]MCX9146930.1 hypothetical protein [Erythrobacter sp. WG]